jgi:hypothetical protein
MTTYSFQARPDGAVRLVIADRELPKPTDGFEEMANHAFERMPGHDRTCWVCGRTRRWHPAT